MLYEVLLDHHTIILLYVVISNPNSIRSLYIQINLQTNYVFALCPSLTLERDIAFCFLLLFQEIKLPPIKTQYSEVDSIFFLSCSIDV